MHGAPSETQRLRARIVKLLDRVEELESLLGADPDDIERFAVFELRAGVCATLLGLLLRRKVVSHEAAQIVLYGGRPEDLQPQIKSLRVHVWRIRKQLRLHGIEVETVLGVGYALKPEAKAKVYTLIGEAAP